MRSLRAAALFPFGRLQPNRAATVPLEGAPNGTDGAVASTEHSKRGMFSALRHRNFRLYIGGMLVATAGSWMQMIAQGWLVYQLTGSELMLGLVGFAAAIPALTISPWAGVVVDRYPKRTILLCTQVAAMFFALILAALTLSDMVEVWQVMALAVCMGVVNAFDAPARQAFVVEMVGKEDLSNAIAINSLIYNSGRIIGPAIGGILLAFVGAGWCFLLNGLSFVVVIAAFLSMKLPLPQKRVQLTRPWLQLKQGFHYVQERIDLSSLILQALIVSVFGVSYSVVLPAFADKVLMVDATGFGLLNTAAGLGAATGSLAIARYGDRGGRGKALVLIALIYPFILFAFAYVTIFPLSLLLAYLLGIGFLTQFALVNTLLQTRVDDDMRGRVMSLYTITFMGFMPLGNLGIGVFSERWGISIIIALSAVMTLALTILNLRRGSIMRSLE
jgi:MFS family permease